MWCTVRCGTRACGGYGGFVPRARLSACEFSALKTFHTNVLFLPSSVSVSPPRCWSNCTEETEGDGRLSYILFVSAPVQQFFLILFLVRFRSVRSTLHVEVSLLTAVTHFFLSSVRTVAAAHAAAAARCLSAVCRTKNIVKNEFLLESAEMVNVCKRFRAKI